VSAHLRQLAGQQLGPYLVLDELGSGGQGAVLPPRHAQSGQEVALKLLLDPEADPKAVLRFGQEAQILSQLRHPNLPRVLDVGRAGGLPYLALERIEGESLAGEVTVPGIARQLLAENVARVDVVSNEPEKYPDGALPPPVKVHHRSELARLQRELKDPLVTQ